jgi:hypothetical protein
MASADGVGVIVGMGVAVRVGGTVDEGVALGVCVSVMDATVGSDVDAVDWHPIRARLITCSQ